VIEIPSLKLDPGIYWLKGVNGSGKTTLLKMIAALVPFKGDISLNDISLRNTPVAYRHQLGWAEAEPLFPPFMTGIELLSLYRDIRKISKKEVESLLEIFNIAAYVKDNIGTYSAGMIKKLSLALAFTGNPPLIILDEPLITLDAEANASLRQLILEKHRQNGTAFLMSSHQELDLPLEIGKELYLINKKIHTHELSV
jgi:ABC-2 type transport system ATP-binding protein